MRRKLFALLSVLLLFSAISIVRAEGTVDWISGKVTSVPGSVTISGNVYWQFGFTVEETNGSLSGNVLCMVPWLVAVGSLSQITLGAGQNMTGTFMTDGSLQADAFLVSGFNGNGTGGNETLNLESALRWVWGLLGSLGNVMVSELQYFCQNSLNIAVPTAVMNSILLTVLALVWWYVRRLPWFISVLMFFVCIGLASSLVTTMGLM